MHGCRGERKYAQPAGKQEHGHLTAAVATQCMVDGVAAEWFEGPQGKGRTACCAADILSGANTPSATVHCLNSCDACFTRP